VSSEKSDKEFLSIEEVAALLDVNYQLIYRLIRTGDMPAARIGKVYRVSRRDLDAYLEKTKTSTGGGGVCSACGKTYRSSQSLNEQCKECGEFICFDCWDRKKVHHCKAHQTEAGKKK